MTESWKNELTDNLCRAFVSLNDIESVYAFLEDVASIAEIKSMSQRLEVARLLSMSKTYPEVSRETGASTATISRVKKCLDYGKGGYQSVIVQAEK